MKKSEYLRRSAAVVLSLALCLCAVPTALAEDTMSAELMAALAEEAHNVVQLGEIDLNMYINAQWAGVYHAAPSRFDLRDIGVVPAVRSQGSWGTCWGFASIAACETSILSKLGLTREQFVEKYGRELNLSEKHLAWFGTGHLPLLGDYPEGEYIYPGDEGQAGEGLYQRDEQELGQVTRYNNGGYMGYASVLFASGIGPVYEAMVPYEAADGTDSTASDWTLDDSLRFGLSFELENSSLLPCPAQRDAEDNYVYDVAGTEAIKSELLNGRGVSIAYHADMAMDPDAKKKSYQDEIVAMGIDVTDELMDFYMALANGEFDMEEMTPEQSRFLIRVTLGFAGVEVKGLTDEELKAEFAEYENEQAEQAAIQAAEIPDAEAEAAAKAAAEEQAREKAGEMGIDYDEYVESVELALAAENATYINIDTYAQHTDDKDAGISHAVTIIGWDDDYPVSNFLPDHQPPADGAWIVRNSWGADYGNDGYFYLSYYDQSLLAPETFEFVVADIDKRTTLVDIMSYDLMQASSVSSAQMKQPVNIANVFDIESDSVLSYVSIMTADLNANVSVAVYLLDEDATSPTDGTMLDIVTDTFLYGGYHRIALNYNYLVPKGAMISVVQVQRAETSEGRVYSVPYTTGTNQKHLMDQNVMAFDEDHTKRNWAEGKIGKGESYINLDGAWVDWGDVIAELQAANADAAYISYDNLNMKLYAYPLSEIETLHELEEPQAFNGAQAQICSDCGYAIIEQE